MADDADAKSWQDFKFTVDVVLASALAREELAHVEASQHRVVHFKQLAAADSDVLRFPAAGARDTQQLMAAVLAESVGELRMSFQAIGYAAMMLFARRGARMVSADGRIEVAFRFDGQAHGIAVLADDTAVRRALIDFSVVLD
jgi:hypothetical protein